jgi:Secretion system C-terminal sorting domain
LLMAASANAVDSVAVQIHNITHDTTLGPNDSISIIDADGNAMTYEVRIYIENSTQWNAMAIPLIFKGTGGVSLTWNNQGASGYGTNKYVTVPSGCRMDPPGTVWDFGFIITEQNMNGTLPDTIVIGGVANNGGILPGTSQYMMAIHFTPGGISAGNTGSFTVDTCLTGSQNELTVSDPNGATFYPIFTGISYGVRYQGNISAADDKNGAIPLKFGLDQNYPNPFNPSTSIKFSLARKTDVNISIYNILGQKVYTLVDGLMDAGAYTKIWPGTDENGSEVASGIYFYKISSKEFTETRKMMLMR